VSEDARRHDRQERLDWIGAEGQERLRASHALVVGCGALGSTEAELLVRAGVGTLTLVDRDVVEWSNLQRQSLFGERDARDGAPKAEAAKRRLREIDSTAKLHACVEHLDAGNVASLARGAGRNVDVIVDGLDNAATRYLLNDFAVREGIPFVHAAAVGMEGRSLTVRPRTKSSAPEATGTMGAPESRATPCLRCFFPDAPAPGALPTCDTIGVFGPLVSMTAAFAASQALRLLAGRGDLVASGLWTIDLAHHRTTTIGADMRPDPSCPCCGARRFEWLDATSEDAAVLCGRGAVQIVPPRGAAAPKRGASDAAAAPRFDLERAARRLATHGEFVERDGMLHGTLTGLLSPDGRAVEVTLFGDGRAIIGGSSDPDFARSVYARFVGT